jgi:ribosomal protein S13
MKLLPMRIMNYRQRHGHQARHSTLTRTRQHGCLFKNMTQLNVITCVSEHVESDSDTMWDTAHAFDQKCLCYSGYRYFVQLRVRGQVLLYPAQTLLIVIPK